MLLLIWKTYTLCFSLFSIIIVNYSSSSSSNEFFHFPVFFLNSPVFPKEPATLSAFCSGCTLCTSARTGIFWIVEDEALLNDRVSSEAIDAFFCGVFVFVTKLAVEYSSVGAFTYCPFLWLGEDRQTGIISMTQNIKAPSGTRAVPTNVKSSNMVLKVMAVGSTTVREPSLFST